MLCCWEVRLCLVRVKTWVMENRERKIWWKMAFSTIWLRGGGGEKSGRAHKFSLLPPSKYNFSKLERKLEWKVGKIFGQNCPTSFNFSFVTLAFFSFSFFLFFFLWFCQVVGSSSFPSFLFFFNLYFYYFFKKTLLEKYNVLLFVLFKRDIW